MAQVTFKFLFSDIVETINFTFNSHKQRLVLKKTIISHLTKVL